MGSAASSNDEWLELYNPTGSDVSLESWTLEASDDSPKIILAGRIKAGGFYLLERTDDNTLPGIQADQIYKGALNNDGEKLELYDDQGNLIDSVDCLNGWSGGDNQTKQTMERTPFGWQSSVSPGGTPKAENSTAETLDLPLNAVNETTTMATTAAAETFPTGILINEILPSPDGPDEQNEWIEIANTNSFSVDLAFWRISDNAGSVKEYSFPQNTTINAFGFLVLGRPESKITLNNDGDALHLSRPDGTLADSVSFGPANRAESYIRTTDGSGNNSWTWSENPTPGFANAVFGRAEDAGKTDGKKENHQASVAESLQNNRDESEPAGTKQSFLPLFFGLTLAVFFGILILFVKKRLLRYNN